MPKFPRIQGPIAPTPPAGDAGAVARSAYANIRGMLDSQRVDRGENDGDEPHEPPSVVPVRPGRHPHVQAVADRAFGKTPGSRG
jgi:hypothetical protein